MPTHLKLTLGATLGGSTPTTARVPEEHLDQHSSIWSGLHWTPWGSLDRDAIRRQAPSLPGIYRIRRSGAEPGRLVYIGQTGRTLRERLLSLAAGTNAATCPYNDPHTAAPHLWLLRTLDGVQFECSCAPAAGDTSVLRATEDMLLWQHRIATGASAEANYGRFYSGYSRPTNRWLLRGGPTGTRTPGRRAEPFVAGIRSTDFGDSRPGLYGDGGPLEATWWQRTSFCDIGALPSGPAVYCIYERAADEPMYIGETTALPARAATHALMSWRLREPWLAYLSLPDTTPKYVLREFESDLLGWHFWRAGRAPSAQYAAPTAIALGVPTQSTDE